MIQLATVIRKLPVDAGAGPLGTLFKHVAEVEAQGKSVLRAGLVRIDGNEVSAELAIADVPILPPTAPTSLLTDGVSGPGPQLRTAIVVPTGVGARIGGYIADAGPFARAVAGLSSCTILHPNVVNGGDFYAGTDDSLYVDGYTLDRFFLGEVKLGPVRRRRIGLMVEKSDQDSLNTILNAANAMRAIFGIDIVAYDVTDRPIEAVIERSDHGHFVGSVGGAHVLLQSASRLQQAGADAIAVVTACTGTRSRDWEAHYKEAGPNPVGSLEALISRFLTRATGLPVAHAPAYIGDIGRARDVIDPRAAGEVASGTGLPCILKGLSRSPSILSAASAGVGIADLSAIIVPFDCCGGVPAWGAQTARVPLVAVRSNRCLVGVSADAVADPGVLVAVDSPAEALAWLACVRAGVSWDSVRTIPCPVASTSNGLGFHGQFTG